MSQPDRTTPEHETTVDVDALMAAIRARVAEKRAQGLYSADEIFQDRVRSAAPIEPEELARLQQLAVPSVHLRVGPSTKPIVGTAVSAVKRRLVRATSEPLFNLSHQASDFNSTLVRYVTTVSREVAALRARVDSIESVGSPDGSSQQSVPTPEETIHAAGARERHATYVSEMPAGAIHWQDASGSTTPEGISGPIAATVAEADAGMVVLDAGRMPFLALAELLEDLLARLPSGAHVVLEARESMPNGIGVVDDSDPGGTLSARLLAILAQECGCRDVRVIRFASRQEANDDRTDLVERIQRRLAFEMLPSPWYAVHGTR
ncbi:MAG: hypothetical protein R2878_01085 [Thermoleophilia bacterium]